MQNIETLFARELKVEEARSVYPEYGFTESMGEHITTRAYATIASLLLYGAKRGMCAVAVRPQSPAPQQQPQQLHQPQQTPFGDAYRRNVEESSFAQEGGVSAPKAPVAPKPQPAPKQEETEVVTGTLGTVEPEITEDSEAIDVPTGKTKEGTVTKWINKFAEIFAGKDDEYTF